MLWRHVRDHLELKPRFFIQSPFFQTEDQRVNRDVHGDGNLLQCLKRRLSATSPVAPHLVDVQVDLVGHLP